EDVTNNEQPNSQINFTTDSEVYLQSENIKIVIKNNLNRAIIFGLRCNQHPEISYQKKVGDGWSEKLSFWWESLKCATVLDTLDGNNKYEYEITPEIFEMNTPSAKRLDAGTYRLVLGFSAQDNNENYLSYSNNFEIK
ncbi:MAG: hypothetical protein KDC52_03055, partial [Ignavibacteriae bacterium]|nr:hypothetical protein [Ignavibacteriota bacterium]